MRKWFSSVINVIL
ncbi:hypothetical protein KSF78_0008890 [Schistosoma japonicum]|nr:hypothetical protein KSF78_0008890 [Schistosoma japonicum]